MKLSASEWIKRLDVKCEVLDPDGWDRTNFAESWIEAITKEEFFSRMDRSTCVHKWDKEHEMCSCAIRGGVRCQK